MDAELLIGHVLGLGRGELGVRLLLDEGLEEAQSAEIAALVDRRAAREPLQHLTGRAPFRQLDLAVGPGVFVPRPETELTAQLAIAALLAVPGEPTALDAGTGSGAIAIALATEVPHARVTALERSADAHRWARQNVAEWADGRVDLRLQDLADFDGRDFDVVVSNPPYVPDDAVPRDPEVRDYDPPAALYGGADGLDVVRVLSRRALDWLRPGGTLIVEHGELQAAAIRGIFTADGWRAPATHRDLLGRDRVTSALRP